MARPRRQERESLFAQRGHIAPNAAKSVCASQTAETARDLLLDFDHAQIPLGQIVVKIHAQIFQEAEDRFLVFAQAMEQIACVTLFASTPLAWGSSGPRVELIAFIEQTQKLRFPIHDFLRIEMAFSQLACLLGRLFHIQQQTFEIGSPDGPCSSA